DSEQPVYRQLKSAALEKIADQQINATARNYYLLYAKELLEE
ncbi:MAG: alkyl sulfatase dimerization domain-containing protein, partial [Methyloligellaceae bacterium]